MIGRGRESKKEQTGTVDELVWWEGHESCLSTSCGSWFLKGSHPVDASLPPLKVGAT